MAQSGRVLALEARGRRFKSYYPDKQYRRNKMYKPLPKGLTVAKSEIEGLGLFAIENIEPDTVLGIAHIANSNFPHGYIRTALGAFYNHSDTPNCELEDGYWQHMKVKYLVVKEYIKTGAELTAKYTLYEADDDFI